MQRLGAEWSKSAELSVYLKDEVTPAERSAVEAVLAPGGLIASREYISKSDALVRFRQTFGELAGAADAAGDNPLPASVEARVRPGPGSTAAVDELGNKLREMGGVSDVRYDRQWLNRVLSAIRIVRGVGWILGAVLTIAAALTVANVVRLALYARRDELEIMQLVGAPQAYIRGPFVMEGVLQGGLGALLALSALAITFFALKGRYLTPLASTLNMTSIHFLPVELSLGLVLGGMLVGCVGGLVAAWNR
jgi:cell division transport system permease protein